MRSKPGVLNERPGEARGESPGTNTQAMVRELHRRARGGTREEEQVSRVDAQSTGRLMPRVGHNADQQIIGAGSDDDDK